ncbi:MAG: hypothetical protein ACRD0J_11230, partial [Acidimicrobiales bacterium]
HLVGERVHHGRLVPAGDPVPHHDLGFRRVPVAHLLTARLGIDSSKLSAHYISGWQGRPGADLSVTTMTGFRNAVMAADRLFTELS